MNVMGEVSVFLGVSVEQWKRLAEAIMECEAVSDILIYGSRVKGTYRKFSDIDLTLKGDGLRHTDLFRILDRIDELNLPYETDLSIMSEIDNPALLEDISLHSVSLPLMLSEDMGED